MTSDEQALRKKMKAKFTERLVDAFLDAIILARYQNCPFSGYDALLFIQEQFGLHVSPGTVYSTIYNMERQKLVELISENKKRIYQVTEKGKLYTEVVTSPKEIGAFMQKLMGATTKEPTSGSPENKKP